MSHQLVRDLCGEGGIEATANVDRSKLLVLAYVVRSVLFALEAEIGLLCVGLRLNRNILTSGHRHRPCD